jgi:transposase
MRPQGSAAELERRRRQAVAAVNNGEAQVTVARVLGVPKNSVWRWIQMSRDGGDRLAAKPHPGRPREMTPEQERQLVPLLQQGAKVHGWPDDLWTAARVTAVIQHQFGVCYHVEHVRHILKDRLGWTSQRPELRARERNEAEIERWKREDLPRIQKRSRRQRGASCAAG